MKIQPNMSEHKRNDKESMICLMPKPNKNFFIYCIESKENFLTEKELLKEKEEWGGGIEQKMKRRYFNCSCYGD